MNALHPISDTQQIVTLFKRRDGSSIAHRHSPMRGCIRGIADQGSRKRWIHRRTALLTRCDERFRPENKAMQISNTPRTGHCARTVELVPNILCFGYVQDSEVGDLQCHLDSISQQVTPTEKTSLDGAGKSVPVSIETSVLHFTQAVKTADSLNQSHQVTSRDNPLSILPGQIRGGDHHHQKQHAGYLERNEVRGQKFLAELSHRSATSHGGCSGPNGTGQEREQSGE